MTFLFSDGILPSQYGGLYPRGQTQGYRESSSTHSPPFLQGFEKHFLLSEWNTIAKRINTKQNRTLTINDGLFLITLRQYLALEINGEQSRFFQKSSAAMWSKKVKTEHGRLLSLSHTFPLNSSLQVHSWKPCLWWHVPPCWQGFGSQ